MGTSQPQTQEAEPDMMRPLQIAACLALAIAAHSPAASAQQAAGNAETGRGLT